MIIVNEYYALRPDEYNYTLMHYKTIDPANSVKNKGKSKDEIVGEVRQEWVSENKYYPKSNVGLASALKEITIKMVDDKLKEDINISLHEYIKLLREEFENIRDSIDKVFE